MTLLIISFLAGILTVAAPCILPLLPIIIGGSLVPEPNDQNHKSWSRPLIITISLIVSLVSFSLLLKATTSLLGVPQMIWQWLSGGLIIGLGIYYLKPEIWTSSRIAAATFASSNQFLGKIFRGNSHFNAVLVGLALGPVFNSCSPTYALIVAAIIPVSFVQGTIYLFAYALGLAITLLLISFAGQRYIKKLNMLSNPNSYLKKIIAWLFILTGLVVGFGIDKKIQTWVIDKGWYAPVSKIEEKLRN